VGKEVQTLFLISSKDDNDKDQKPRVKICGAASFIRISELIDFLLRLPIIIVYDLRKISENQY